MIRKIMFGFAATALLAAPALGADDPNGNRATVDTTKLSVLEVLNIGTALQQFGDYRDAGGKEIKVPLKFDGSTLLSFAINIAAAEQARKAYQDAYTRFETQEIGDVTGLSPEDVQKKKIAVSGSDAATRLLNRPAGALLSHIKEGELCMKSPPVAPCTATNSIPPALLAAILPIIDR